MCSGMRPRGFLVVIFLITMMVIVTASLRSHSTRSYGKDSGIASIDLSRDAHVRFNSRRNQHNVKDTEIRAAASDIEAFVETTKGHIRDAMPPSANRDKLIEMYGKTFMNTVDTTMRATNEGRVFVITGDINAMWLRDSAAQVEHYTRFVAPTSRTVRRVIAKVVSEHAFLALMDPYANAFNDPPEFKDVRANYRRGGYVSTGNYELDSFAYSTRLAYQLWREAGETKQFDELFRSACRLMMVVWRKEQRHAETTTYRYDKRELRHDGLENSKTGFTGMTWTGFRASDDDCKYHYNVPDNMMASVALRYMREMALEIYDDKPWAEECAALKHDIDEGIRRFGIIDDPKHGRVYAYEVDGLGHYILEDDANIPSLLSMPYLNYTEGDMDVWKRTVDLIWSRDNPWFFSGKVAEGIGSRHTGKGKVWHMSMIMKILVTDSPQERSRILLELMASDNNSNLMHEGFDPSNPRRFSRSWFAWANSLFALMVTELLEKNQLPHV